MGLVKTTVEITDALLEEAKRVASRESSTLRELIEEGLRRSLEQRRAKKGFRLRRASFRGKGLQPGVSTNWDLLREIAYEGRGG
jgi:enoyl-CoA hydratase/carnithine racemase